MIATWSQIVSVSPTNFPSRKSARERGFERIVYTVRRSTSRWISPMPTKIAMATPKRRIAPSPTSCRMRSLSTYDSEPTITLAPIMPTAKKSSP